jgi:nitrogen fixation protein FixH
MKPAAAWPLALVAVLALTVVANVAMLAAANAPGAASIEPDYYRRALAWDSTQAERARSAALGWRAEAAFTASGGGGATLAVSLREADLRPVAGAQLEVLAIHNLEPGPPVRWPLVEIAPGAYRAPVRPGRAGRWELRLRATRFGDVFTSVLHADLVPGVGR